jgi:hypothetical protein
MMDADTSRRAEYLFMHGWTQLDELTWELDTSDKRWSLIAHERATGTTSEEAMTAAFGIQRRREALELRERQKVIASGATP